MKHANPAVRHCGDQFKQSENVFATQGGIFMRFLQNPNRFDLLLDGISIWEHNPTIDQTCNGAEVVTTVTANGLRIVNTARKIDKHSAYE